MCGWSAGFFVAVVNRLSQQSAARIQG